MTSSLWALRATDCCGNLCRCSRFTVGLSCHRRSGDLRSLLFPRLIAEPVTEVLAPGCKEEAAGETGLWAPHPSPGARCLTQGCGNGERELRVW